MHMYINSLVAKGNKKIGLIERCFSDCTEKKVTTLYQTQIRPVLEYASPTWSNWLKKHKEALEKVQRRCLRLCKTEIELPRLETRRLNQDLCEVYKLTHDMYKTDSKTYFTKPTRTNRGHSHKLYKPSCKTNVKLNSFSHRVIDPWNNLPEDTVSAPTLASFKRRLRSLPSGEEG